MNNQRGLVSLLTTIIISILLVIITFSMVTLMAREARQAEDADQSIRAYYAADAGIENALWEISKALASGTLPNLGNGACNPPVTLSTSVVYTCQRVYFNTNTLTGNLAKEAPIQVDLTGLTSIASMKIEWNDRDQDDSQNLAVPAGSKFSDGQSWQYPAVLEISAVTVPQANPQNFKPSQIGFSNTIVAPGAGIGTGSINGPGASPTTPLVGQCNNNLSPGDNYNCHMTLNGFNASTYDYIIRVRPRYAKMAYKMQFFDGAGNLITVPDQMATIDVTAKAGDVYRRVITKIQVRSGVLSGLDYVLYSDTDICKDFSVNVNIIIGAGPNANCKPLP